VESRHIKQRRHIVTTILAIVVAVGLLFAFLSIPTPEPAPSKGASGRPFAWKLDERWKHQEAIFAAARDAGCERLGDRINSGFEQGRQVLEKVARGPLSPDDPAFGDLEMILFDLGSMVGACPDRLPEYIDLLTTTRSRIKAQSRQWDVDSQEVRDRLYRLLYGGRAALEEVMLQAPLGAYPALIRGDNETSVTPSLRFREQTLHSGDILVSRGGAPTSAIIARGNDYPGNFSHVALLHVDEKTGVPGIVEAHIERGVVISRLEEYIKDVKLRVMVLRLRADLAQMKADPMLPHKAATLAVNETRSRHIPYDFAMAFREPSKYFCSEVASHAYSLVGVELWRATTTMSSPGLVRWLGYFGVEHFETQAPADLEYDPQLVVVAEWRDPKTLWKDHIDNAVTDAMLEGAEEGDRIGYPWYLLAPARLVKAYSAFMNLFGRTGPIPEGMDAVAALRSESMSKTHEKIRATVLAQAASFQEKHGYKPPYWQLVRMAQQARGETPGKTAAR
jgi:hypothetical protein